MGKFIDLTGQKIGKLTVIERAKNKLDYRGNPITCWKCQCECGKIIIVRKCSLTTKKNLSCGCARINDLKNKKFGKLTVIKIYENKSKGIKWICKCDCGNETIVYSSFLTNGHTKSCGCLRKEKMRKISTTHNLSKTKIFKTFMDMKRRCYTKSQTMYKYYGEKGIKICNEWMDKENGFVNFYNWAMQNGYKENLSIDRIDVNGNYEPNNCRWISMKQQANNRTTSRYITYKGETYTIAEWSKILNLPYKLLHSRYNLGHCVEDIFYNGDLRKRRKKMKKVTNENYFSPEISQIYTGSSEIKRFFAM